MITDRERQRLTHHQQQRERYLLARQRTNQPTLAADCELLTTRVRHLPVMLVAPYALLAGAGALDLLFLVTGNGFWSALSFAMIPAGVFGCVAAVAVGLHEWFAAPAGSRVRGVGVWFAIGTALVVTIFAQSWVARFGTDSDAGGLGVVLGFMGAALALLTGWLLGEYLDRLSTIQPAPHQPAPVELDASPIMMDEIVERRRAERA